MEHCWEILQTYLISLIEVLRKHNLIPGFKNNIHLHYLKLKCVCPTLRLQLRSEKNVHLGWVINSIQGVIFYCVCVCVWRGVSRWCCSRLWLEIIPQVLPGCNVSLKTDTGQNITEQTLYDNLLKLSHLLLLILNLNTSVFNKLTRMAVSQIFKNEFYWVFWKKGASP